MQANTEKTEEKNEMYRELHRTYKKHIRNSKSDFINGAVLEAGRDTHKLYCDKIDSVSDDWKS